MYLLGVLLSQSVKKFFIRDFGHTQQQYKPADYLVIFLERMVAKPRIYNNLHYLMGSTKSYTVGLFGFFFKIKILFFVHFQTRKVTPKSSIVLVW